MAELIARFDPSLVFLVILPAGLLLAAWTLQISCVFSAVKPPDFWQSLLCMFLILVANVILRFWVNISVPDPGLGANFIWPLIMTSAIIAVMVRTGPVSALVITVFEGGMCACLFIGISMLSSAILPLL